MLTTILCDLDGTLVDSRRDIARAFRGALHGLIDPPFPDEAAIACHIGKPLTHMIQELGYTLSPGHLETFLVTYRRLYATGNARHTRPYPGVVTTLQGLASMRLGIVTTKEPSQATHVLQQLALLPFFHHVQGSSPGMPLKPAPDPVLAALKALHAEPHRTLMIGDTPADILAGRAAGVQTCAVTYGFGSREELEACAPDHVIGSFAEVSVLVHSSPERPDNRLTDTPQTEGESSQNIPRRPRVHDRSRTPDANGRKRAHDPPLAG
jgi:phosphoglycolate phosphatase